jgi:D-alanyl-D-alanine carboxypeptidase
MTVLRGMLLAGLLSVSGALPTAAAPALLFDANDGTVLYAEEADQSWHPASLTKLMTAYLAFEALKSGELKPDDKLVCSEPAFKASPSKVGLKLGGEIAADLAIRALVVKSANDMAIMLGEKLAGSEEAFVARMNATAKRLGMTRTHFANASGLPNPAQVTTARDLAMLTRALIADFPEHAGLFAMPVMTIGNKKLESHNKLLKVMPGADGMKTGFICDSGYNIVASATRDGRRLVAVVLGEATAESRNVRAMALIEHGFETYFWKTFFSSTTVENMPVSEGATATPTNVRSQVLAWACGNRKAKVAAFKKAKAKKAAKGAQATAEAAAAFADPASVTVEPETAVTTTAVQEVMPAEQAAPVKKKKKKASPEAVDGAAKAPAAP